VTATAAIERPWRLPHPYGWRSLAIAIGALLLVFYTGQRVEMGRMLALTGQAVLSQVGLADRSQVAEGLGSAIGRLVPLQISDRQEIGRIENFDAGHLPWFSHLEVVETREDRLDPLTSKMASHAVKTSYLVRPLGYVQHVALKMLETLEIALWGTLIAILIGLPLAMLSAPATMPLAPVRTAARGIVSFFRAIPELISALFLVIAYGFGPIAGVLALGIYAAGFLGKFYAEDMENADPRPQEALVAIGAGRLATWRFAILPQVMPQYIGYTLYILDRNVRMATVIGLVGAGGIGQELKGRYDMYEYGHVGTILIAIFLVVLLLDQSNARLRRAFL